MPSHPELLDWLASRFPRFGRLAQTLHRLIVTSAVYRQSVRHEPSSAADRRRQPVALWRQNRRRLDAESIHDAILGVAGALDSTMGGPSVQQFTLRPGRARHAGGRLHASTTGTAPAHRRRSVYRFIFRTLPDPFFDALDAADASQLTAVRNESTTPLQALELLNNPFVLRQCEQFAGTLEERHRGRPRRSGRALPSSWPMAAPAAADEVEFLSRVCRATRTGEPLPPDHQQQ